MTLVLVIRSIEGIAIVTDSTTTVQTSRVIDGEETPVEYHIYGRQKLSQLTDYGVVHTGMSFINKKTITQIVDNVEPEELTFKSLLKQIKKTFKKEIIADDSIPLLDPGYMIVNLGITGYRDEKPFVHRLIYLRSEEEGKLLEIIESDDTFTTTPYGIDYWGDFEFIQLVIRVAKERGLLKPFDILTLSEALKLGRTLMQFLIEFQQFMVKFTVAFPLESAVITNKRGFEWVDKIEMKEFHYAHESES